MSPAAFSLAIAAAKEAFSLGQKIINALRRSDELTPEQQAEAEQVRQQAYASDAWKPHGPLPGK